VKVKIARELKGAVREIRRGLVANEVCQTIFSVPAGRYRSAPSEE
jgi:hypothetical protein